MDAEMIRHKIDVISRIHIAESLKKPENRYGARLHYPERKSLDITLDTEALEALLAHFKSRLKIKQSDLKLKDENTRLIEGALENYKKGDLLNAGVELQIVVNRINAVIDKRFLESQKEG